MNRTLKHKVVKIRRPKRCAGCGCQTDKGDKMAYSVVIYEGDFQANYWCLCCDAYIQTFGDGEDIGDFAWDNDYLKFKAHFYETS